MSQISAPATLTAIFDHRHDAERAADRLRDAGVPASAITLTPGYEDDSRDAGRGDAGRPGAPGVFDGLAGFLFPWEHRQGYEEGLRRGGYLLSVEVGADLHDRAVDILDDGGAIEFDEREDLWRSEGWSAAEAPADGTAADGPAMRHDPARSRRRVRAYFPAEPGAFGLTDVEVEDDRNRQITDRKGLY